MNLTNLSLSRIASGDDNQEAAFTALKIEETISTLDKASIKSIQAEIRDLPAVLSSLTISRQQDILLGTFYTVNIEREAAAVAWRDDAIRRLRALKAAGVADPNIDFKLAFEDDDIPAAKDALERGAEPDHNLNELLDRYEDDGAEVADESGDEVADENGDEVGNQKGSD
jgi:hypothetical protein